MDVQENARDRDVTDEEERAFLELFDAVGANINRERASPFDISFGIEAAIAHFRNNGPANACSIRNFMTYGDLLGYFYWSSPISAGVTRNKTLAALRDCEEFRSCLQRPSLKLVSVGGGTGSDLVGFCSAVCGYSAFESLRIVLMDNNRHWRQFFNVMARTLHDGNYGRASHLFNSARISTSFICCDLSNQLDFVDYIHHLAEADIVWMKGVLSILDSDTERQEVAENVIEAMVPGTLLIVLDSLVYVDFDRYNDRLQRIFSTNVGHSYFLQPFLVQQYRYRLCGSTKQEIVIFKKI